LFVSLRRGILGNMITGKDTFFQVPMYSEKSIKDFFSNEFAPSSQNFLDVPKDVLNLLLLDQKRRFVCECDIGGSKKTVKAIVSVQSGEFENKIQKRLSNVYIHFSQQVIFSL
jgi:hypothetical protein